MFNIIYSVNLQFSTYSYHKFLLKLIQVFCAVLFLLLQIIFFPLNCPFRSSCFKQKLFDLVHLPAYSIISLLSLVFSWSMWISLLSLTNINSFVLSYLLCWVVVCSLTIRMLQIFPIMFCVILFCFLGCFCIAFWN